MTLVVVMFLCATCTHPNILDQFVMDYAAYPRMDNYKVYVVKKSLY